MTAKRIAKLKKLFMAAVNDVVIDLCAYSRKNDDELKEKDVDMLIEGGHVTIKEVLDVIRAEFKENYPDAREE